MKNDPVVIALDGKIAVLEAKLKQLVDMKAQYVEAHYGKVSKGKRGKAKAAAKKPGKRKMTAEGRARIAAAQKARWAALRAKKAGKTK